MFLNESMRENMHATYSIALEVRARDATCGTVSCLLALPNNHPTALDARMDIRFQLIIRSPSLHVPTSDGP
jgi:hypothetical protein